MCGCDRGITDTGSMRTQTYIQLKLLTLLNGVMERIVQL